MGQIAQIRNEFLRPAIRDLRGVDFFENLVPRLVTLGLIIGALVFIFMLIWGAISWITSGGDKSNVETARSRVMNAIIGIVVLFVIWAIASLLEEFFGVDILTLDIRSLTIQ
jgi:hypothetical protein